MINSFSPKPVMQFCRLPSVGQEDWRYTFATAYVRSLETNMLSRAVFTDIINAPDFDRALDELFSTEYAPQEKSLQAVEQVLTQKRTEARKLFENLIIDEEIIEVFKARVDFSNMRLALRRRLTERPIGTDYCSEGNVPLELFEQVFEQEDYVLMPEYVQDAVEQGVLRYYENRHIPHIDYGIDDAQAQYNLQVAQQINSVFLTELFLMQIDLTNIRTMLRVKWSQGQKNNVFIHGGYVEPALLEHCVELDYEAIGPVFMPTPYEYIIENSIDYLQRHNSFLRLEALCDNHLQEFLRSTFEITAGPQPVIAYLLLKEDEIRTIRMVVTAKKNNLDTRLVTDRLGST
ncbi:MAG: V-type ATPase subunit [Planctomycetota bacterium]